ncbi:MAG: KOW motif-containing protein, partial [Nitrososphaerota archaeon]|nr:KOW motif-containing protein [Nitrososphaerota archaeon]
MAELNNEDTIEIVAGPFKGMRAKISRVEKEKQEITVSLLDTAFAMPITIDAAYAKLVARA